MPRMAKVAPADPSKSNNDAPARQRRSLIGSIQAVRQWASASPVRSIAVGTGLLLLVVGTVGTWLYLAALTVQSGIPTIDDALAAYDKREWEEARYLVAKLTDAGTLTPQEYGGPLFVLGATKAVEAETHWSPAMRQSQYLIASKYLQEAKSCGFPKGRAEEGCYLLGRSLLECGETAAGLEVLEEALATSKGDPTQLNLSLATACIEADPPEYQKALQHIDAALEGDHLIGSDRVATLCKRIEVLSRLGKFNEARATLQAIPSDQLSASEQALTAGRIDVEELRRHLGVHLDPDARPTKLHDSVASAIDQLKRISPSDDAAEEAMLLVGDAYALTGATNDAIRQFERVRKLFTSSTAGVAASVGEGDLYREFKHDDTQALTAYRRSLSMLESPSSYRNAYLPLHDLRLRMITAHADFLARDQFESALTLAEQLGPLLGKTKQIELLAQTRTAWGEHLIDHAGEHGVERQADLHEGRLRLREAGLEYEELAKREFATRKYTSAVWDSAKAYFDGQSYTSAARMLGDYLRNEPVQRNAQALLLLGQANLALGKVNDGILALEECIELHPQDAAVFRARLDCAKALRESSRIRDAEQLLLANLHSSGLTPQSAEWRESLFELGRLLHDTGNFDDAIDRLSEAVERDIDTGKARLANYMIAESYRQAANKPLSDLDKAKTANERESSTREVQKLLNEALRHYEKVRSDIAGSNSVSPLDRAMLRNCYMFKGSALFELGRVERSPERFRDAIDEFSNVSTLYQNEPFVLETFVQIANCQQRRKESVKARLNIDQALQLLAQLPADADFLATTNFTRSQWELMLTEMRKW